MPHLPLELPASCAEAHRCIPESSTSNPHNPIPEEPLQIQQIESPMAKLRLEIMSESEDSSSSEIDSPATPNSDLPNDATHKIVEIEKPMGLRSSKLEPTRNRRASTKLVSSGPADVRRILGKGDSSLAERFCCGEGCCFTDDALAVGDSGPVPVLLPTNEAFRSLQLTLGPVHMNTLLTNTVDLPEQTVSFVSIPSPREDFSFESESTDSGFESLSFAFGAASGAAKHSVETHPPTFVTPHPPYAVHSARVHHARELTKPGAEKRTFHFDIDVTDYPAESGKVDFVVGGAIGVCAPNSAEMVNDVFDTLCIPRFVRDKQVLLKTTKGRWPTIWGDEQPRELLTTRRELLTWCADLQSYPPSQPLLRLLAEHAMDRSEKKILLFLCSTQGQAAFCNLRTGPHITIPQLLHAFPSSKPPFAHLLSALNTLMPRFYSLSQDPQISRERNGDACRRLIEVAVTVHETADWRGGHRTGVGSGFLERLARQLIAAEQQQGVSATPLNLHIPMFRGLMANPLAREFVIDGPMLLIGAGVGIAPFRGFVQRRLKSANCANKVWVLQGVRDSLLDELYSGEWGVEEAQVKKVVESRRGEGRYVQEEVRHQADLVWFVINALDGRVFVCGSSAGMGEGVEQALLDVAMDKGNLNREEAVKFWDGKKENGQYIAETW